jgi:dephospho-CoA kinase
MIGPVIFLIIGWHYFGFPPLLDRRLVHPPATLVEEEDLPVANGHRLIIPRFLWNEIWMGCVILMPICALLAQCLCRWSVKFSNPWIKNAVAVVFLDVVLELFLSSLQFHPEINSVFLWQYYFGGARCKARSSFLKQQEMCLFILRFLFITLGFYLGQAFLPVALTGSIATGKSTVAKMLLTNKTTTSASTPEQKNSKKKIDDKIFSRGSWFDPLDKLFGSGRKGTCTIIDTDRLGHEILLPPSILQSTESTNQYSISAKDSVYHDILNAFGDVIDHHKNILDDNGMIERRKLGAIIFADPAKRRILNRICHPKIILVMLKQLVYQSFWGQKDIICADVPLLFESGKLKWLFALSVVVACNSDLQYRRLRSRNPDLSEKECQDRIQSQMSMEVKVRLADIVLWNNTNSFDELSDQVELIRQELIDRLYGFNLARSFFFLTGGVLLLRFWGVSIL